MKTKLAHIVPATRTTLGRTEKFSYLIPQEMKVVEEGSVVKIPFGSRSIDGVVFNTEETESAPERLKSVEKLVWPMSIFTKELRRLSEFIAVNYVSSLGWVVKLFLARYAPKVSARKLPRAGELNRQAIILTTEQKNAEEKITKILNRAQTVLLHGVTGSGKTEVYLNLVEKVVKQGKQALILVPEIILTPQTFDRFLARFNPSEIAVIHSKISYGQKSVIWQEVFGNKIKILIGPRSALFAPFSSLGLIVMDEEHDSSYKQFDQSPRYHASAVTQKLSEMWQCPVILSDATPSVESYYYATQNRYQYLPLRNRPSQEMPSVELVNMVEEIKAGNFSIFSQKLITKIEENLEKSQQVILFLNRRGTATSFVCRDCGTIVVCPRCDVPLVYHRSAGRLTCHHCTRSYPVSSSCGKCGRRQLKFIGTGTEKVEAEIAQKFSNKQIRRLDSDTIANAKELKSLYDDFKKGNFDILVGTQLVARGWDLSRVGLIGVINADSMLALPDFRSNERTFQLITQVAGRSGRGKFRGHVIVQTFSKDNFAIQAAAGHGYKVFFEKEIADRKEFGYPPFARIVKISFSHTKHDKALQDAQRATEKIKQAIADLNAIEIIGPSAAFIPKEKNKYFYHVIIKVRQDNGIKKELPKSLTEALRLLPSYVTVDVDPDSLL